MRTCVRQYARMYSGSKRNLERARQRPQLRRTVVGSVSKLYRIYRRATDGADGATGTGLSGPIRPTGLVDILLRMGVEGAMWRGLIILTDYDRGDAYHLREVSRARTHDS